MAGLSMTETPPSDVLQMHAAPARCDKPRRLIYRNIGWP
jgi:hypothetical protein